MLTDKDGPRGPPLDTRCAGDQLVDRGGARKFVANVGMFKAAAQALDAIGAFLTDSF